MTTDLENHREILNTEGSLLNSNNEKSNTKPYRAKFSELKPGELVFVPIRSWYPSGSECPYPRMQQAWVEAEITAKEEQYVTCSFPAFNVASEHLKEQ